MKERFDYSKVELKAKEFSDRVVRAFKLTRGDEFYLGDKDNIVKVGDKFRDYPAVISGVEYTTKRWWQFWKRRKQKGYFVRWLE